MDIFDLFTVEDKDSKFYYKEDFKPLENVFKKLDIFEDVPESHFKQFYYSFTVKFNSILILKNIKE